ncbi:MAG: DNRLRE domain-containing protein [Bacteroidota bacterium]
MRLCFSTCLVLLLMAPSAFAQTTVTLPAAQDNTLFEASSATALRSNGSGDHLFAGNTARRGVRRALIQFDIAGNIPAGATIEGVSLELTVSKTISGGMPTALHRVSARWGEGSSDASGQEGQGAMPQGTDATWQHARFDEANWSTQGGDFASTASATLSVAGNGRYTWASTAALVADVQAWLDAPDQNFGWIVIGNESITSTAKRFNSRENATESTRPALVVTYSGGTNVANEREDLPTTVRLSNAYPNPFQAQTTLRYDLDQPEAVTLTVYDLLGRPVATLAEGMQTAGSHTAVWQPEALPNGLYIARLTTGGFSQSLTITLLR